MPDLNIRYFKKQHPQFLEFCLPLHKLFKVYERNCVHGNGDVMLFMTKIDTSDLDNLWEKHTDYPDG